MPGEPLSTTDEVGAFQKSISAPTAFAAASDLIQPGLERTCLYGDNPVGDTGKAPLTHAALSKFVQDFDLRQFGIGRGDTVCTSFPNGAEAAVCFWAISNQCVFAPLNPRLTVPEVEFELVDLPCHTMILMAGEASNESLTARCRQHNVRVLMLTPSKTTIGLFSLASDDATAPAPASAGTAARDLALVLHTSGTTKKPKIVPLTHHNIGHGIQFVASTLRRTTQDVCVNVMPLFHIHGLIANLGVSVYAQASVVCSAFFGGANFIEKLSNASVAIPTWYSAVPTMHEAILLEAEAQGTSLKHSLTLMRNCSAALLPPVSQRFLQAFGEKLNQPFTVVPTYAMTESFPICSNPPHLEVKLSTVGPAMGPNIAILKAHPEDTPVAAGEEGEVCVRGECVTEGYLIRDHMPCDPNIEAFSLADSPVGRMLRTGDKGYIDADGYLQLVGRFKEIINCGGEKISPLELEEQLLEVEGVETCVCFAHPAMLLGEIVGCAVVPKAGATPPTIEALREGCKGAKSQFRPSLLVLMDQIPKGPTGKPRRIGLSQYLKVPAFTTRNTTDFPMDATALFTYAVAGKDPDLAPLQWVTKSIFTGTPATVPAWQFPLTITLDVHPDLGDFYRQLHTMVIGDSLCTDVQLSVTTYSRGEPVTMELPVNQYTAQEALFYLKMRQVEDGMVWKAREATGKQSTYDYCCYLLITDGSLTLDHQWETGCHDPPPGCLIRLMRVDECEPGTEYHPVPPGLSTVDGRPVPGSQFPKPAMPQASVPTVTVA